MTPIFILKNVYLIFIQEIMYNIYWKDTFY